MNSSLTTGLRSFIFFTFQINHNIVQATLTRRTHNMTTVQIINMFLKKPEQYKFHNNVQNDPELAPVKTPRKHG